jgi:tetracycline 7-halogenase / FADH2 O2-dependent halogenase
MYDVAIIGSGLAGSTLATILSKRGLSVLMLEANSHPRFAIGESVVPEFGARARVMAELFEVPELGYLSTFQFLRHHVSGSSGVKRSFTFMNHRAGEAHRAGESCQFQTMTYPLGPDSHLYRPEVDLWLTNLAVRYGVDYRDRSPVADLSFEDDGVTLQIGGTSGATTARARFLVDGSGFRSLLAERKGLRREPDFVTDSRTIFTHMTGVGRIAEILNGQISGTAPSPPDQGTLHHVFDGGWFWVIPFDNHTGAINQMCSVGLTLDRRKNPDNDLTAAEEWDKFVARFPTIARQFQNARPVREWVKTGRLQYGSTRIAGARWCLMPHAAGFVDALFSGGNTLTMSGIQEIARALLDAFHKDPTGAGFGCDDDASILADYESGFQENQRLLDRMVHGAFVCMKSPEMFNAWFRFWAVSNFHGSAAVIRAHLKFVSTRDRSYLERTHGFPFRRVLGMQQPRLRKLNDDAYDIIARHERGELDETATTNAFFDLLGAQDWIPPQFHVTNRGRRHLASFTAIPLARMIRWGRRNAPSEMREDYYDVGPIFFWELTKSLGREGWRNFEQFARVVMNAHFTRGRA